MSDDRIWSADELEKLTPAERQRLLDERVVTDLSTLPDEFVDRIRREGAHPDGSPRHRLSNH